MDERTDEELMRQVGQGDLAGVEPLVLRYQDRLLRFLTRIAGDAALAEDLFQETFLRVYQAREKYRYPMNFAAWLFTIARRLCLNEIAKRGKRRTVSLQTPLRDDRADGLTLEETLASEEADPLATLEAGERSRMLEQALEGLPEQERTILHLNLVEGMRYKEIAGVAGCSAGAIKARFFRAFRTLERTLRRRGEEGP